MDDAKIAARLGAVTARALRELGASSGNRPDGATTRGALEEHDYALHGSALRFDAAWGGLTLGEYTIGAAACAPSHERGGRIDLIPVVLTDNDNYYFLDADGRGWGQDGIEDPEPLPTADTGDCMLARIILYHVAFDRRHTGAARDYDHACGEAIARDLNLPLIAEASDSLGRTWGDDDALVFERAIRPGDPLTTLVAVRDPERLAKIGYDRTP